MAVTPVGNPYVESSDLVANYPGASEALAERIDIVGVNPFANAAARDAAIPSPVQGQMCSLNDDNKGYRYDGSAWVLFSGAGAANFTDTATGTYTDGGIDYKYITFTGSGSLVVDQAGFADVLLVAGGGGAGGDDASGGGGAGGHLSVTSFYFTADTHSVVVGAGGARGPNTNVAPGRGNDSTVSTLLAIGGGASYSEAARSPAIFGGSGAGGNMSSGSNGAGIPGQGFAGGTGATPGFYPGGGGGGGSAVGGNATSSVGGAGGAGASSSITGSAVTRAGGGGGGARSGGTAGAGGSGGGGAGGTTGAGTAGSSNTGGGGGGTGVGASGGGAGGSGLVIVRVVV